jgi:hypothetical protein
MSPLNDYLFGPLTAKYCDAFYALSLVAFIYMVVVFVGGVGGLLWLGSKKTLSTSTTLGGLFLLGMYLFLVFWAYLINRLFYNMCLSSAAKKP